MEIPELVRTRGFVVTAELGPPKGTSMQAFYRDAALLKGFVQAANVTDGQAALMKMGSLACSHLLKDQGIEPILQITCRDRNRIALQSDLLSASALGIRNVLVLTGDPVSIGDHPDAKPVFDLDATTLMSAIRTLETGVDLRGNKLDGAPEFAVGAAMNPCVDDVDTEISKTRRKLDCGAEFFQTQGVFDAERFLRFLDRYRSEGFKAPVLAGIILVKSAKMARFMNEKIPGIVIGQEIIDRIDAASDKKAECVRIAVETIRRIRGHVQGVHLMAIGWEDLIGKVVSEAGLA